MMKRIIFLLLVIVSATSCVTRKEITYFQPETEESDLTKAEIQEKFVIKLQAGDVLNIRVNSLSPEANEMFNIFPETGTLSTTSTTTSKSAVGFMIDKEGNISLPLAGKIMIGGLSTEEAATLITEKLEKFLQEPTVNVRLLNFKISILGEVNKPSVYNIENERVSLPEAIGLAGDLTIFGKRENILIIREVDGEREFARVDFTQRDFLTSPYYYLRPNDVIYVEPKRGKLTKTSRAVQLAPIYISALTFFSIIISNVIK